MSRSGIAHCSIAFGGRLLDPSMHGNRYWPTATYATTYPGVVGAVTVAVPRPIDLDRFADPRPKRAGPTFMKLFTFGRIRTRDCACTVKAALADGGLRVPDHVLSPRALRDWLIRHGGEYVAFDGG